MMHSKFLWVTVAIISTCIALDQTSGFAAPPVGVGSTRSTIAYTVKNFLPSQFLGVLRAIAPKATIVAHDGLHIILATADSATQGAIKALVSAINDSTGSGVESGNAYPMPRNVSARAIAGVLAGAFGKKVDASSDPSDSILIVHSTGSDFPIIDSAVRLLIKKGQSIGALYSQPEITSYPIQNSVPAPATATGGVSDSSGTTLVNAVATAIAKTYGNVAMALDPNTNTVAISGDHFAVGRAYQMLRDLDQSPAEIELDAAIYEVSSTKAENIGLNLPSNAITTTVSEFFPSLGASASPTPLPILRRLGTIVRSPLNTFAQLNLLINGGAGLGVAYPQVRVLSGRTAYLNVGDQIPYVTFLAPSSGNSASLVGSSGSIQTGLQISVVASVPRATLPPMASAAGADTGPSASSHPPITLFLHPTFSTFVGFTPQGAPQTSVRETQTTLQVADGQAVVISGLRSRAYSRGDSYIPPFQNVPLIGGLFHSKAENNNDVVLYVVIVPHVVPFGTRPVPTQTMRSLEELFKNALPGGVPVEPSAPIPPPTAAPTPTASA